MQMADGPWQRTSLEQSDTCNECTPAAGMLCKAENKTERSRVSTAAGRLRMAAGLACRRSWSLAAYQVVGRVTLQDVCEAYPCRSCRRVHDAGLM